MTDYPSPHQFFVAQNFNPPCFCNKYLLKKYRFATIKDTEALYVYDSETGDWKPNGDQIIKTELSFVMGEDFRTKHISECIAYITGRSYIDRTKFNRHRGMNLANGVLNLKTLEVTDHSPDYYFTYSLPVIYDKEARPQKIAQFLADICDGNGEKLISLLEAMAFCLIPNYEIQKAIMLVGNGSNGKSTYLNLLRAFIGPENTSALTLQQITESSFSTANLFGKLANISADLPSNAIYDTGIFKAATGGDSIFADQKFRGGMTFNNTAKLFFAANRIPPVSEDSIAYFRRWLIIEMTARFDKPEKGLLTELTNPTELSGLLNLLVEMFLPVLNKNLAFTYDKTVDVIKDIYSRKSNSAQAYIDARIMNSPESEIPKEQLWKDYCDWTDYEELIPVSEKYFWTTLKTNMQYLEAKHQEKGILKRWIKGIVIDADREPEQATTSKTIEEALKSYETWVDRVGTIGGIFLILNKLLKSSNKYRKMPPIPPTPATPKTPKTGPEQPILAYLKRHGGEATRTALEDAIPGSWANLGELENIGEVFRPRPGVVKLVNVQVERA